MKTLDYLDLNLNELRNFVVQILAADPANTEARLYYNSTSHTLRFYNGTTWTDVASASYTDENARDAIAAAFTAGSQAVITFSQSDPSDTMSMTITAGSVTNTMHANMAANTVKANTTGGAAAPSDVTLAAFITWLALVPGNIGGFDTQVRTSRLDQMAAPTASVSLNNQRITSLLDPTAAQEAATKAYVDSLINGLDWKQNVRVATTANSALASTFENGDTIDGVVLATGDRILIKNQTTQSENGIYTVNASGVPTRAADADVNAEVTPGLSVIVTEGTTNGDTIWFLTSPDTGIVVGTSSLVFAEMPTPNMLTVLAPLVRTGNQLSLDVTSTTHVARVWSGALTGGATSEVITHNLGTRDVHVQVINNASPWDAVLVTWEATSTTTVTIRGAANLPAGYRVVVMG